MSKIEAYVIEFRNGAFYGGEVGVYVPIDKAKVFSSYVSADEVLSNTAWMFLLGPMVVRLANYNG